MDEAVRALVRVSAALSPGATAQLREAFRDAAQQADPGQVEEVLLQSYLFAGYPACLNAFKVWRDVSGRAAPAAASDEPGEWDARGEAVCSTVYGASYARLRKNVAALHPDMDTWMVREGYGKVLGRPGLPLATRELCIVALLVGLDAEPQLFSHLRGALNAGATTDEVEAALREAGRVVSADRRAGALDIWRKARASAEANGGASSPHRRAS